VKRPLGAAAAVIAIVSAAGSALAADLPLKGIAPAYVAQEHGKSLPSMARPDQRSALAVTGGPPKARDKHVLEFLRWKEQQSAAR
jgi:hypothetical protein